MMFRSSVLFLLIAIAALISPGVTAEAECCGVSQGSSCPDGYQSSGAIDDQQLCMKSTDGTVMGACIIDDNNSLPTCKSSGSEAVKPIETTNVSADAACCQASSCPAGYQTSGTIGDNQLCTKKSTEGTVTCGNIDGSLPTCTGSGSEAVKPIETTNNVSTTESSETVTTTTTTDSSAATLRLQLQWTGSAVMAVVTTLWL